MPTREVPLKNVLLRLAGVSLLPLLLFAAWLTYDNVRTRQTEMDREAANLARNFANSVDQHLQARIAALSMLAQAHSDNSAAGLEHLYRLAQQFQFNFGCHVILAEAAEPRQMLFNTRRPFGSQLPQMPLSKGFTAAPAVAATGRPAVGDVLIGTVAREPLVAIGVPVRRAGAVHQVLLATFDTAHFRQRAEQVTLPSDWRLSLLDGVGEPIAVTSDSPANAGADLAVSVRFTSPSQLSRWVVVVDIPRTTYYATLYHSAWLVGLGLLASTLLAGGAAYFATRRLQRAVSSLAAVDELPETGPRIAEIQHVRRQLAITEALRLTNETLEQKVEERTRELAAARDRITRFAVEQERGIEQERRRVAREVHDQLGQIFTGLKLIVQTLPAETLAGGQGDAMQQALDQGIASARKITADLRPPLLDDLGLAAALEHFAHNIEQAGGPRMLVSVSLDGPGSDQSLLLFRIAQEAVTNCLRYAKASQVIIRGERHASEYWFSIEDDGIGFDPRKVRPGAMGLLNIRERAALMNGACGIGRTAAGGTRISIRLPVDQKGGDKSHESAAG